MIHLIKGKNSAELKFASFQNDLNIKPYAIFYDSQKDSVIVAVRGTLSLEDCITDANCASVEVVFAFIPNELCFQLTNLIIILARIIVLCLCSSEKLVKNFILMVLVGMLIWEC